VRRSLYILQVTIYSCIKLLFCKGNQKVSIPQIKLYFISEEQQGAEERKASAPLSQAGIVPCVRKCGRSACSDHPALTGSPPNSGGEVVTLSQQGLSLVCDRFWGHLPGLSPVEVVVSTSERSNTKCQTPCVFEDPLLLPL